MESCLELLDVIAQKEGIRNPEIALKESFTPGEGFLGIYQVADIRGKEKCLNVFVKQVPTAEDELIKKTLRTIFLNEFVFYDMIYPRFVQFEEEKGCVGVFKSVAKCYKTVHERSKEALVLDNMKSKGYKLYNKKEPLDEAHMELMLEEIAHFHAISFAFKDQRSEEFEKLAEEIHCVNRGDAKTDFENTMEYITNYTLECLDPRTFREYQVYKSYVSSIRQFLNSVDLLSEDFTVIVHGDLTINNIMFQYEDKQRPTNIPTNVCILDWQLTRVTSPVIDLSYFFYGSCSGEQMQNVDYYLEFYYKKLCNYIRSLGSDPNVLYSWKKFLQQWSTMARYGLTLSFLVIKIMLTEPNDILSHQSSGEKKSMLDTLCYKIKNEEKYRERVKALINHFIEKDYLEPLSDEL